jgi:hypothetical protein
LPNLATEVQPVLEEEEVLPEQVDPLPPAAEEPALVLPPTE